MYVIITDVTYMSGERLCVAGWDVERQCMARPLLPGRQPWTVKLAHDIGIEPGAVMRFVSEERRACSRLPHAREDVIVRDPGRVVGRRRQSDVPRLVAGSVARSFEELFGGSLVRGKLVAEGTDCPSLCGIEIEARRMRFHETTNHSGNPQLRCSFPLSFDATWLNLPVVAKSLRDVWNAPERDARRVNRLIEGADRSHIRLGLARGLNALDGSGRVCYAMMNGVFFF